MFDFITIALLSLACTLCIFVCIKNSVDLSHLKTKVDFLFLRDFRGESDESKNGQ